MAKTKKKPEKNLGGRPRKAEKDKARRVVVYLTPAVHDLLAARALAVPEVRDRLRDANEGRPRSADEERAVRVNNYAKFALEKLAGKIAPPAEKKA